MLFLVLDTKEEVLFAERLYLKYSKFMYKVAYSILHDKYSSEDAVQQALIRIIKNLSKIDEEQEKQTRNFIGLITRNVAIDIYNSNKKQPIPLDDYMPTEKASDISTIIIDAETLERIKIHIYSMKEIYQTPLLMLSQGYTVKEIAETLEINPKTIQKRLERGRAKLYTLLSKEEN